MCNYFIKKPELELISNKHEPVLGGFDCENPDLNSYLQKEALADTQSDLSKTYVLLLGKKIIAFYTLIYATVESKKQGKDILGKKYKYSQVPVMKLGRLAVDKGYKQKGFGTNLLRSSFIHAIDASKIAGLTAILVDAKDAKVRDGFYKKFKFEQTTNNELQLFLPIKKLSGQ